MVNRTQTLVLAFFLVVLVSVIAIRVAAPDVYDQAFRLPPGDRRLETIFLAALVAFAIAVFQRWRWIFWLITVAFLAGVLRVPVVTLQLMGFLAGSATPTSARRPSTSRASTPRRSSPLCTCAGHR
jgi:hypothetical protein